MRRLIVFNSIGSGRLMSPTDLSRQNKASIAILLLCLNLFVGTIGVLCDNDDDVVGSIDIEDQLQAKSGEGESVTLEPSGDSSAKDQKYISPKLKPDNILLLETFDDVNKFKSNWIQSKDGKYEGKWDLNSGPDSPRSDLQLLLPTKARHYAISSKFYQPFKFSEDKPLVVQYEVQFREGLDCGGAYVKLLRNSAINDLSKLHDKTPFTIMFGPDKCGSESKLHFIIQYLNPNTHVYEEKHWKGAKSVTQLMSTFSDKKHHLFKLVLEPSNNFEIFLDDRSVGKGNLLTDLDPAINPAKEIVDPNDTKPADWDEHPQIEDPDATKPDDWDDNAPKTISDPNAQKPSDWLENEPKYIPDKEAKKPDDWEEMDGEWEAPLVENPACAELSGCGAWIAPVIPNPNYRGKWKPPKIDNPNYKGKWSPRMIQNPYYFFDENPFKSLEAIGAIAFELWSMADNLAFDNLIVASDKEPASLLQYLTWQNKKAEDDSTSSNLYTRLSYYLKSNPYIWVGILLAIALPLFLFISYCCDTKRRGRGREQSGSDSARRKKADESRPDDSKMSEEDAENGEETGEEAVEDEEAMDEEEEDDEEVRQQEVKDSGDKPPKRQVRQRKKN